MLYIRLITMTDRFN